MKKEWARERWISPEKMAPIVFHVNYELNGNRVLCGWKRQKTESIGIKVLWEEEKKPVARQKPYASLCFCIETTQTE